ncbi:MAG: hypothetical protein K1X88_08930 [Nannocystaceae bacterium]|nr:hypothetical protein [Nannocystaceae bacterium]
MKAILRRLPLALLVTLACERKSTTVPPAEPEPTPVSASTKVELPAAETVLASAVEAEGGAAAHTAIKSYYLESRMDIPQQGLTGLTKLWWKDGKFFMQVDMAGVGTSSLWCDGAQVVSEDPINGRRTLAGKEARQAQWSASVSLPHDWKKFFDTAKTIARREHDGRKLIDVSLSAPDGSELLLSFDETTHLLASQRFAQASPMGELPVEIAVDEYKQVGGLQHAAKTTMSMAIMKASSEVTKFEPNVEIDDGRFTPPAPKPVEPAPPVEPEPAKGKAKPKAKAKKAAG